MSKNNKVIIASVGVLIALIMAVLLIRSPAENKTLVHDPPRAVHETPSAVPEDTTAKAELDGTHKKVAGLIDDASDAVVKQTPTLVQKIKNSMSWFMAFDTKHAIIILAVLVFVIGIIAGGKKKSA